MKSAERMSVSRLSGSAKVSAGTVMRLARLLVLGLLVAGCATTPEKSPKELLSYLPGGHSGYISVAPSDELFLTTTILGSFGFAEDDARRIADRTERALVGVGPEGAFSLVAMGRFPDGSIARNLRRDGWTETEADDRLIWNHGEAAYRIERIERDLYAVRSEGADETASSFELPREEGRRLVNAGLGFYAPQPGRTMLSGLLGRGELPIEEVYVEFKPADDDAEREVVSLVTVRNEEDARTLLVLTRLLVLGTLNAAGIAFEEIPESLSVEREGSLIVIDGLYLREAQIARLFLDRLPEGLATGDVAP